MHSPKCWTPVFIPCHFSHCKPPPLLYKLGPNGNNTTKKYFYGHKRKYIAPHEHLNQLIKHPTSHICTKTNDTFWKSARDGPIPFYFCGNLLDDRNHFDLQKYQDVVLNRRRYAEHQSFITFSPISGLCDFTKNQVCLASEPIQKPVLPVTEQPTLNVPVWTCSPRCIPPPALATLQVENSPEYQEWLINIGINSDKIKYQVSKPTKEFCTVNPEAAWHMHESSGHVAFFCTNYSVFGISYHLPLYHPKRWTLAYQFTQTELKDLDWLPYKEQQAYYMQEVMITRQAPFSPYYKVTRYDSGEWCEFSTLRFGIGTPIFDKAPDYSVIYEPYEADMELPAKILQFHKRVVPDPHDLMTASRDAIALDRRFAQHAEEVLVAQIAGMSLDPQSEQYQKTRNSIIQQIALGIDPTANLSLPQSPRKTEEQEKSEKPNQEVLQTGFVKPSNRSKFFNFSKK
jgi:hypothetical protein